MRDLIIVFTSLLRFLMALASDVYLIAGQATETIAMISLGRRNEVVKKLCVLVGLTVRREPKAVHAFFYLCDAEREYPM